MLYYTKTHDWVKIEGTKAFVGITKEGAAEIGDIVFVELPKLGTSVLQGQEVVVVESTKAAVDIYSPLSGIIVRANDQVKAKAALINYEPESNGWLYQIEISNPEELKQLLTLKP